jgi:hypothetical protein
VKKPAEFNIPEILRSDFVFMTKQGLQEIEAVMEHREGNYYRNKKVSRPEVIAAKVAKRKDTFVRDIIEPILEEDQIENFDDSLPLQIQTPTLKTYIDDLRRMQEEAK